jgi:nicotinate-nucleotide adenylyltransferase
MRIAFFGGTFDPVHRGHIAIARAAAEQFGLDEVIFAPVGRQPLKTNPPEASFRDRVAMARLACADADGSKAKLLVSEVDAARPDGEPNYTVDTLRELAEARPDATLFAISGADSFLTFRSWRDPDVLLELAEWIVFSRPGFVLKDLASALALSPDQRRRVHLLETVHEDVSASELRRRLSAGDDCSEWLPRPVLEYIREHGLYAG